MAVEELEGVSKDIFIAYLNFPRAWNLSFAITRRIYGR